MIIIIINNSFDRVFVDKTDAVKKDFPRHSKTMFGFQLFAKDKNDAAKLVKDFFNIKRIKTDEAEKKILEKIKEV